MALMFWMVCSRMCGRRMPAASVRMPSTEPMTSGFFAIWPRMCSGFGFCPRNTSSTTTDSILNSGTTTAIRIETVPSWSAPSSAVATGMPIMT